MVKEILLEDPDCVTTRVPTSISIKGNLLTIGTRQGSLLFWDIKADKFLQTAEENLPVSLKASECRFTSRPWKTSKSSPAILTHCFDTTGSRLFTAGSPRSGYIGFYIAIWQHQQNEDSLLTSFLQAMEAAMASLEVSAGPTRSGR